MVGLLIYHLNKWVINCGGATRKKKGGLGFPDSSVGEESTCNAGEPSSILGSGTSAGEGIGYPLQYSWACSSVGKESTCSVGDLGSMPGLGRCLQKGKATHASILAWRIPWTV